MEMPEFTPRAALIGAVGLGALVSGIYRGVANAHGSPIDPTIDTAIKYGPIALNMYLSAPIGKKIAEDPKTLDKMVEKYPNMTREQLANAPKGCATTGYVIGTGVGTAFFEVAGYYIGNLIGHAAR